MTRGRDDAVSAGAAAAARPPDRRRGEALRELPCLHPEAQRRLETEGLRDTVVGRLCTERHDPHRSPVARRHDGRVEGCPRDLEHDGIGVPERTRDAIGFCERAALDRHGERGCRHHCHDRDALGLQALRQVAAVRLVDGDQNPHGVAPDVGTTERADSSAIAARVAATSDRGMTISRAAEPPPIIESSRVTETTVASATRMRGTS